MHKEGEVGVSESRKYQLQHNYVWRTMDRRRNYDRNDWFVERTNPQKGTEKLHGVELLTHAPKNSKKTPEERKRGEKRREYSLK